MNLRHARADNTINDLIYRNQKQKPENREQSGRGRKKHKPQSTKYVYVQETREYTSKPLFASGRNKKQRRTHKYYKNTQAEADLSF